MGQHEQHTYPTSSAKPMSHSLTECSFILARLQYFVGVSFLEAHTTCNSTVFPVGEKRWPQGHSIARASRKQLICNESRLHCSETENGVRVQEEVPLMMRSSSGLHSHSLRLAKQDSITSLQTKLRQQFRQSERLPLSLPPAFAAACALLHRPLPFCCLKTRQTAESALYCCLLLSPAYFLRPSLAPYCCCFEVLCGPVLPSACALLVSMAYAHGMFAASCCRTSPVFCTGHCPFVVSKHRKT